MITRSPSLIRGASLTLILGSLSINQTAMAQAPTASILQEVIVSATKTGELEASKIPISIQAISGEALAARGAVDTTDFLRLVPGLSTFDQGPGDKRYIIRGVNSGGPAVVGVYLDEAVLTETEASAGNAGAQPDIRLFDLERIEVLKGPQGTTFGSSALSGIVRYITRKPDLKEFTATATLRALSQEYSELGYGGEIAINLPVVDDVFALRVAGYIHDQPGYIDNAFQKNVNNDDTYAVRINGLWALGDNTTLSFSAMRQDFSSDGRPFYNRVTFFGDPVPKNYSSQLARSDRDDEIWVYGAGLEHRMASGTITLVGSYSDREFRFFRDASELVALNYTRVADPSTIGSRSVIANEKKSRIQSAELRYASDFSGPLQVLVGAYYQKARRVNGSPVVTVNQQGFPDPAAGVLYGYVLQDRDVFFGTDETAGFGELAWSMTDRLTLTVGARAFEFKNQTQDAIYTRFLGQPGLGFGPVSHAKESSAIGRANLSFQVTPDQLIYAQVGEGYRPGGANNKAAALLANAIVPDGFESDSLVSYEIGYKGVLGERLRWALAGYFIDWSDTQISILAPSTTGGTSGYFYIANAGATEVRGVELEMTAQPFESLTLGLGAAYTNAEISEFTSGARIGDRMPYVPRINVSGDALYRRSFGGSAIGYFGADISYMSERYSSFPQSTVNYHRLDSNTVVGARLGVEYDSWEFSLIGKNIFNDDTIVDRHSNRPGVTPENYLTNRPRTIIFQVSHAF